MNELEMKIAGLIEREGPMTFERFMEMALYDPDLGYYSSGRAGIGREGDFFTSPHLHAVFGMMIGRQIEEMWDFLDRPADFRVIEMGAGAGYLCRDILDSLRGGDCYRSMAYTIIDVNPRARQGQEQVLSDFGDVVSWHSSLAEVKGVKGCVMSNELVDAFPVHLVKMEGELSEVYVDFDGASFSEKTGPLSTEELSGYFRESSVELPRGYGTEVNLAARDWLSGVTDVLDEGFVLTVDYGYTAREYFSEDRDRGTLMCYYRHEQNEDPFRHVGEQDITSHVNFSDLRRWGEALGLKAVGYCSQGSFLLSLGIDEEIRRLSEESADYLFELAKIKRLILPQGMGESHMVLIQYKGPGNPVLRGFGMRNRLKYL